MTKKSFGQRINIDMGANLLLSIEGIEGKLNSHLIGLIPSEFIIVKTPVGYSGINDKLFDGNKITIRYIQHGHVYAFEAFILSVVTKPKSMLILSYPTTVSSASIRKVERHDCFIPCSIGIEGQEYTGTVMDISLKGCRCLLPELPSKIQNELKNEPLDGTLKFESPSNKDEVELPVSIVNQADYKSASKIGISFGELSSDAEKTLISLTDFLEKH